MPEPLITWQEYGDVGLAIAGTVAVLLAIVLGMAFARMLWGN